MALPPPAVALGLAVLLACGCGRESLFSDPALRPADLTGTVADADGRPYPGVRVLLDGEAQQAVTLANGEFRFDTVAPGDHVLDIGVPPATRAVTALPASVPTGPGLPDGVSIVVAPRPVASVLNLGPLDVWGEVRDANGEPPGLPSTPLFARNVAEAPLGLLVAIETPLGLPVTRAMWEGASGVAQIACTGHAATVAIQATGLIPNGTYSVWLALLGVARAPGEPLGDGDVLRAEPLGSPSPDRNVFQADAAGTATLSARHPGCVLTQATALLLAIQYHLTGATYGLAPIPDAEEVTHLWVYAQ